MSSAAAAHLAHIDLIPSSFVSCAVAGAFSAPGRQDELALARHDAIELLRVANRASHATAHREPTFATVRAIARVAALRPGQCDSLAVTSDSGALSLLRFAPAESRFVIEAEHVFGRGGVRRAVPGHFLAADYRGRAIYVAALEATKLVYPLLRVTDAATGDDRVCLQSPIELTRPGTFTLALCALFGGPLEADQPRFAALEAERGAATRLVVIYEYDAAMQTAVAVASVAVPCAAPPTALVALPAQSVVAPLGGVLVIAPGDEQVHALALAPSRGGGGDAAGALTLTQISATTPRRAELPPAERPVALTGVTAFARGRRDVTLVQSELGDLFRVELSVAAAQAGAAADGPGRGATSDAAQRPAQRAQLTVRYFDTTPVAAAMVILRAGVLAVFGDSGSSALYRITGLGPDSDAYLTGRFHVRTDLGGGAVATREVHQFRAAPRTSNLEPILSFAPHVAPSAPTLQMALLPAGVLAAAAADRDGAAGALASSSRGGAAPPPPSSSSSAARGFGRAFVVVRGKGVENSGVALLRFGHRATINGAYALDGAFDSAVVLSAAGQFLVSSRANSRTIVFATETLTVVQPSGFVETSDTLAAAELPDGRGVVQVHRLGMRHLGRATAPAAAPTAASKAATKPSAPAPAAADAPCHDWRHPAARRIAHAAANTAGQVLLGFESGGLMLFEYDAASATLRDAAAAESWDAVACVAVAPAAAAGARADIGVVCRGGVARDLALIRLTSATAPVPLRALQAVPTSRLRFNVAPVSVALCEMGAAARLFLVAGLEDGTVVRVPVDARTGALDTAHLSEVVCGAAPAHVVASPRDRSCLVRCASALWRLAVADTQTYTQVPVSVVGDDTTWSNACFVCALATQQLPDALLIVNAQAKLIAIATLDASSPFYESALARPAATGGRAMARRVLFSRDRAVGVVLECEGLSRCHRIRAAAAENDAAAAGGGGAAATGRSGAVVRPRDAAAAATVVASGEEGFVWALSTFNLQRAVAAGAGAASSRVLAHHVQRFDPAAAGGADDGVTGGGAGRFGVLGGSSGLGAALAVAVGQLRAADARGGAVTSERANAELVIVSVAQGAVSAAPLRAGADAGALQPMLYTLSLSSSGALTLLHRTIIDEAATCLHITPVSRWLVAGCGRTLAFYVPGRSQLLRKTLVADAVPTRVVALASSAEDLLCVADAHESIFLFRIAANARHEPVAVLFADDIVPRGVTCAVFVDPLTVAVGDRFGTVAVLRCTAEALAFGATLAAAAVDDSDAALERAAVASSEATRLKGAPRKLVEVASFFVGAAVVSLDREFQVTAPRTAAAAGGVSGDGGAGDGGGASTPVLVYGTALGRIGALLPLSDDDFAHLARVERVLRAEFAPLLGRDHAAYRSSFTPSAGVVDVAFVAHAWRSRKEAVEGAVRAQTLEAQTRAESVGLPPKGARPLEAGLSELFSRAVGNVE
jgi:hypothetical protein